MSFCRSSLEKGEVDTPCKEAGVCDDQHAECYSGMCRCIADYFKGGYP